MLWICWIMWLSFIELEMREIESSDIENNSELDNRIWEHLGYEVKKLLKWNIWYPDRGIESRVWKHPDHELRNYFENEMNLISGSLNLMKQVGVFWIGELRKRLKVKLTTSWGFRHRLVSWTVIEFVILSMTWEISRVKLTCYLEGFLNVRIKFESILSMGCEILKVKVICHFVYLELINMIERVSMSWEILKVLWRLSLK